MRLDLESRPDSKLRARRGVSVSRSLVVFRLLMTFVWVAIFPALDLQAESSTSGNRFLFVVDCSAAMKHQKTNIIQIVAEIIQSGASRQLRRGDTLGVWTFDKEVYSDLPLQTWDVDERGNIASHTADFLGSRAFSGTARFDRLLSVLLPIIHQSDVITVILISDGKNKIKGTPFDQEINDLYQKDLKESKARYSTIVTVLQGRGGKVFQYTVNALPWPVVIPEVPIAKGPVAPTPAAPPAVSPVVKPATGPPLIIPRPPVNFTAPPAPATGPLQTVVPTSAPPPFPKPPAFDPTLAPPNLAPPQMIPPPPPAMKTVPSSNVTKTGTPKPPAEEAPPPLIFTMDPKHPPPLPTNLQAAPALSAPKPVVPAVPPLPAPATISPPNRALAVATTAIPVRSKILLVAGVILAIIGFILIILTVIRGRDVSGPSLITRSMNDRRK